jgi:calcium-dependent protein kinase
MIDQDNNLKISFSEFSVSALPEKSLMSLDKLQAAFRCFDRDGSGMVSINELKQILMPSKSQTFDNLTMAKYDKNGDGEISYEEFIDMMQKMK